LQEENEEIWKDVAGYVGLYKVSNLGRVKRLARIGVDCIGRPFKRHEMILKPNMIKGGYYQQKLTLNTKEINLLLHRIVCEAFHGPAPVGKDYVNHILPDKSNNRSDNLEWCSSQENMNHAVLNGLKPRGSATNVNKLSEEQVVEICRVFDSGEATKSELSRMYGVGHSTISYIIRGKSWNWLTKRKS